MIRLSNMLWVATGIIPWVAVVCGAEPVRDGQGTATLPDSSVYVGTFDTGQVYEGEFKQGNFHGRGVLTDSTGMRMEGRWDNGTFLGHGWRA